MTPIISNTNTVMIAIVIIRFVAILSHWISIRLFGHYLGIREVSPTCHPPQRLDTPVHISLALLQIPMRVLNHVSLLMEIR